MRRASPASYITFEVQIISNEVGEAHLIIGAINIRDELHPYLLKYYSWYKLGVKANYPKWGRLYSPYIISEINVLWEMGSAHLSYYYWYKLGTLGQIGCWVWIRLATGQDKIGCYGKLSVTKQDQDKLGKYRHKISYVLWEELDVDGEIRCSNIN